MDSMQLLSNANWCNLVEMYLDVNISNDDVLKTNSPILSVNSEKYGWPNFSLLDKLDEDPKKHCSMINNAIELGLIAPMILVHPDLCANPLITDLFLEHGIRQIGQWPLIFYDLDKKPQKYCGQDDLRIVKVEDEEHFYDWHNVASKVLFEGRRIPLKHVHNDRHALYVAYEGCIPVATASAFFGKTDSSAHMVAVLPDYRKKGYGKTIMSAALSISAELGYEYCFSQSSKMGLKSWLNLGYQTSGYIDIFWKVGFKQR